ncbi:YDG/SRA domain-containing protein [Streptomyces antimicrobicus]|uniref:HNH endonuclease n=1 Tax=Streptomyces antimicrobicus TaxID=2883108 RepID=A0ABS8B4V4_9ACTN|nr:YDG/SRA domain-containing protein [Streptomyces antimicrobicus]MCB5179645.1 HNH endonuclease [Streptomyces antimicrobicus]
MAKTSSTLAFGTPDGVTEGDWFPNHAALHAAGLHRFSGRGISGVERTGADSIVLSGGYVDDRDEGDLIIYTGEGGRDRDTGHMIDDQSLAEPGNAALVTSQAKGYEVRVIEGLKISGGKRRRAQGGYRYRGLYRVADHWLTVGQEGFTICQFKLVKLHHGDKPKPQPVDPLSGVETDLEEQARRYITQSRLARDTKIVRKVKEMYDHTCQICSLRLVVSITGEAYSEAAHIQAVGQPHLGEDRIENVLCLCPNCHVLFDRGAIQLTDDLRVIDGLTGRVGAPIRRAEGHDIGMKYARRHRERWANRLP